jgi:hypothetical protein
LLFLVLAAFWWLGRLLGAAKSRGSSARETGRAGAPQGRMVRDRVCNTFIPEEKALRLQDGTGEHFFCSEACRDRFLADKTG